MKLFGCQREGINQRRALNLNCDHEGRRKHCTCWHLRLEKDRVLLCLYSQTFSHLQDGLLMKHSERHHEKERHALFTESVSDKPVLVRRHSFHYVSLGRTQLFVPVFTFYMVQSLSSYSRCMTGTRCSHQPPNRRGLRKLPVSLAIVAPDNMPTSAAGLRSKPGRHRGRGGTYAAPSTLAPHVARQEANSA